VHAEARPGVEEFIATRSRSLLRAAWLLTGDQHKAEDLLQTVLADLWTRRGRDQEIANVDAYARRMLYTTCLTWWRGRSAVRRRRPRAGRADAAPPRGGRERSADAVGAVTLRPPTAVGAPAC